MRQRHRKRHNQSQAIDACTYSSAQVSLASTQFSPASFKSQSLLWILPALVAVNLIIYAQVRNHGFTQWDDPYYVSKNPIVSQGVSWQGVRWAFTTGHMANWHPLTWLSHMLDVQLFGMTPGPHHLINVLFHMANTLLLFCVLFRMTAAIGQSAFVAGLFAAHPLHVESVAWIAERKDVLCAFFFLLTIWSYIAYVRRPNFSRYLLVAALFGLSLMAKPMAVTLPFILFLLDFWPLGRLHPGPGQKAACLRLIQEKVPLIVLAIASSAVTLWVQSRGGTVVNMDAYPMNRRAANALATYVAYLGDMLWPAGLSAFYPYSPLSGWLVTGCLLALAAASVMAVRFARRHPFLLVGWLWYLGTLAPVIGLIQVGPQARADRYTYLPLIGIFIVIAWGVPEILGRLGNCRIPLAIAGGVLICVLAIAARIQASYWADGVVLWEHAVKLYPGSHLVHANLGFEFKEHGEIAKAMHHYNEALRINPGRIEARTGLGDCLLSQGRYNEAVVQYKEALRIDPDFTDARHNLGIALANQGRFDEAIAQYKEALRVKPDLAESHDAWGNALWNQGKLDEAIAQYREALRLAPDFAEARRDLGIALARQGDWNGAIVQYKEALRLKPAFVEAHQNLGTALMKQGRYDQAITHFTEVLRIRPDNVDAHVNLGVALMKQGRNKEAMPHLNSVFGVRSDDKEKAKRSAN